MKHHDLNALRLTETEASALLDEELAKAPEAMDPELISHLLALLSPEAPDARRHEQLWKRIIRTYRLSRTRRVVLRVAAAAAALMLAVVCLQQSAKAFHWQFLQSIFCPDSETFQMSASAPNAALTPAMSDPSGVQQLCWRSWEDIPEELSGLPIKSAWIPVHFTFQMGTAFMNTSITKVDLSFTSAAGTCTISLTAYHSVGEALVDFEKVQDAEDIRYINGCPVRIYQNDQGRVYSAFWQRDHVVTSISGVLTEAELLRIVESLIR